MDGAPPPTTCFQMRKQTETIQVTGDSPKFQSEQAQQGLELGTTSWL